MMTRRRSVIGLLALTLAGCAEKHSTQETDASTQETDASISENDASISENDASISENDASISENDASTSTNDATLVVAYTSSGAVRGSAAANTLNIGHQFHVTGEGIVLSELGIWDEGGDGLTNAHTVKLFKLDQSGADAEVISTIDSVVVPKGSSAELVEGFRFADLPNAIALEPGYYAVIAYGMDDDDPYGEGGNVPATRTGVEHSSFSPYQFVSSETFDYPTGSDTNDLCSTSFRYETTSGPPLRIMPMGDSITRGQGGTYAGYRGKLYELLSENAEYVFQFVGTSKLNPGTGTGDFLPPDQWAHEGHSGWMIEGANLVDSKGQTYYRDGLNDEVDTWLGTNGVTPDVILLMIGTNDISLNHDVSGMGTRLEDLLTHIIELAPNARIIVAQITLFANSNKNAQAASYNANVEEIVERRALAGDNVQLVDMYSQLTVNDLIDGLHPNDSGYDKMALVWFNALKPLFEETP